MNFVHIRFMNIIDTFALLPICPSIAFCFKEAILFGDKDNGST